MENQNKDLITIDDFLVVLSSDSEMKNLIHNSQSFKREYRPRAQWWVKNPRTEAGLACDDFWVSYDGMLMRYLLENKYGVNIGYTRCMSAVKDALLLYVHKNWEVMRNGKSESI